MADYSLRFLTPSNFRHHWTDTLRPRVERVFKKTGESDYPEDVFAALKSGDATAGLISSGTTIVGILVLRRHEEQLAGKRGLYVWVCELDRRKGLLDYAAQSFDRIAEGDGLDYIEFISPRRGWAAMQRRFPGWNPEHIIWRKRLTK